MSIAEIIDGKLYVRNTRFLSTPEVLTYWHLAAPNDLVQDGDILLWDRDVRAWRIVGRRRGDGQPTYVYFPHGVETVPFKQEITPVKCPKVPRGTATRWNDIDGWWEKRTKNGAWVGA